MKQHKQQYDSTILTKDRKMIEGYALTIRYVNGESKVMLTNSLEELVSKVEISYALEELMGGNIIKSINVISSTQAMDALAGVGAWENDGFDRSFLNEDNDDKDSDESVKDDDAALVD